MQDSSFELQRLLGRTARGDRAAFKELYDRTAAKLFGVALRITGRRDIAEDALQECFIAVWQRAADYDPVRGGAMGWMTTILRHTAIDRLRRLGSRPEGHVASADQLLTIAADERADSGAELRALRRCLDELEERPRQAVLLAYLYGMTREELAVHLATPVGTIKSWVRRGLERLKRCLDG